MGEDGFGHPVIRRSPSTGPGSPEVWGVYDPPTGSVQYVCADPATRRAALIDVVWGLDPASLATDTRAMERVLALVEREGLEVVWVLDTHPHADHLTASAQLGARLGAPTAIGAEVEAVARVWRDLYGEPGGLDPASAYDRLWREGEAFELGALRVRVMASPGHTLASVSYLCGDAAFVHDTVMQPDAGTARCDFPGGSATRLWDSIRAILELPSGTRLLVGHDYGAEGRGEPRWEASVAEHRAANVHVRDGVERADWIRRREERDAGLPLPARMLAALQVNLRGGRMPEPEADGHRYLRMPVDRF